MVVFPVNVKIYCCLESSAAHPRPTQGGRRRVRWPRTRSDRTGIADLALAFPVGEAYGYLFYKKLHFL